MAQNAGLHPADEQARLADSRAQFVSSLGRRLEALRQALRALEGAPRSTVHRDNLRRRVHAMGAAAGVLGFDPVFDAFKDIEQRLSHATTTGTVTPSELADVARTLEFVPTLVLGAHTENAGEQAKRPSLVPSPNGWPLSVLVYGGKHLADTFATSGDSVVPTVECARTDDAEEAEHLVRMLAPDVAIVDSDRRGARELIQRFMHDPLLDPVRVIAVGTFERPEAAAPLVAAGVARALPKPVTAETLRRAVVEVTRGREPAIARIEPVGTATVEALSERIAQEIRRGLVESVQPLSRDVAVVFGDGTDVLAAVWSAVARVRELATMRSAGAVRFEAGGPEGAVPLAPWMAQERSGAAIAAVGRVSSDVDLGGRRIVVADDDPAVVWFLSGLLKAAGAEVHEAHDGAQALDLVYAQWPQLVISDILMPKLDGFALCRAIKRDVALSDLPVILLSWKEDLLQRVRELGADADGYLRKEATASVVVQRVREVLRARARVERRVMEGDARGRLEGLTPRLVLETVCERRMDARVSIRDAAFLYEVDIRGGRLRAASRTTTDGRSEQGDVVIAPLLGVRAGRFAVRADSSECRRDFDSELRPLLEPCAMRARAAQSLLSGPSLLDVGRVEIDGAMFEPYASATPRQARAVVARLQDGAAPKELLISGKVSAPWMESVLIDLVLHGAVRGITAHDGSDMLEAAMSRSAAELIEPGPLDLGPPSVPQSAPAEDARVQSPFEQPGGRQAAMRALGAPALVTRQATEDVNAALDAASAAIDAWELPEGADISPSFEQPRSSPFLSDEPASWVDESVEAAATSQSNPFVFAKETSPLEKALSASENKEPADRGASVASPATNATRESLKATAPPKPQVAKKPSIPLPAGRRETPKPAPLPLLGHPEPSHTKEIAPDEVTKQGATARHPPPKPVVAVTASAPKVVTPRPMVPPTTSVELSGEDDAVDAAFLGLLESSEEAAAEERSQLDEPPRPFFSKAAPPISAPREPSPFEAALRSLPADTSDIDAQSVKLTDSVAKEGDWSIAFDEKVPASAATANRDLPSSPQSSRLPVLPTPPPKPIIRQTKRAETEGVDFGEALLNAVKAEDSDVGPHDRVTVRPEDRVTTTVGATPAAPPVTELRAAKGRFAQTLPLGFPAADAPDSTRQSRTPPPKPTKAQRAEKTSSQPDATPRPSVSATPPPLPVTALISTPPPLPIHAAEAPQAPAPSPVPTGKVNQQITPTPPPLPITTSQPVISVPPPLPTASVPPPLPTQPSAGLSRELDSAPDAVLLAPSKRISTPAPQPDKTAVVLPPAKRIQFPGDADQSPQAVELATVLAELQPKGASATEAFSSTLMSAPSSKPAIAETPSGPKSRPERSPSSERDADRTSERRGPRAGAEVRETRSENVRSIALTVLLTVSAAAASFAAVRAVRVHLARAPVAATSTMQQTAAVNTAPVVMASVRVEPTTAPSASPGEEPVPSAAPSGVPEKTRPLSVQSGLPLPPDLVVGADKGLLDFDTAATHSIFVDGVFVGRGPVRRVPLREGEHETRLSLEGEDATYRVMIKKGQRTLLSAPKSTGP